MEKKVIISNRSALIRKYKEMADKVEDNLDFIIGMDARRGLSTCVVMIDDPVQMKKLHSSVVNNYQDEEENKSAIDGICEYFDTDYMTIFGGPDIIPLQRLSNPVKGKEDILSDLPYACNSYYSTSIEDFLDPKYKISRLPDVCLNTEKAFSNIDKASLDIRLMIIKLSQNEAKDLKEYNDYFGLISKDFENKQSGLIKELYGNKDKMRISPPNFNWSKQDCNCLQHYLALYGNENENKLFSDLECKNVAYGFDYKKDEENLNPQLEKTVTLKNGAIIVNQSSYGALLKSNNKDYKYMPLANIYLLNGAAAFFGSTSVVEQNEYDNEILIEFMKSVKSGESLGEAYIKSVKKISQGIDLTESAKKSLAQWTILGDSSSKLVKA